MIKRVFDIVVSATGLLLLWPVLLAVASYVLIFIGPPILFTQRRPGMGEKPFTMLKFRTMTSTGGSDSPRMIRAGGMLRATSLDELPQLWNVLKGEMSLIGPRPLLMEYLPLYDERQRRRHAVRPGITGWAQVNGRNLLGWEEKFELDVWYVENQSFWLDIKILWLTIKRVMTREGISAKGESTMPRFDGIGRKGTG